MDNQRPMIIAHGSHVHQHQVAYQCLAGEHAPPVVQPGARFDPSGLEISKFILQASLGHQAQRERGIVSAVVDLRQALDQPEVGGAVGEYRGHHLVLGLVGLAGGVGFLQGDAGGFDMHVPFAQLFVENVELVTSLFDFVVPLSLAQEIVCELKHRIACGFDGFGRCFNRICH